MAGGLPFSLDRFMFVLPAIFLPLLFGLAFFHLYQIPKKILSGELTLPGKNRRSLLIGTIVAYIVLLIYTLALSANLVQALFFTENNFAAYLSLFYYVIAYPFIYFCAAWIFYHGLNRRV